MRKRDLSRFARRKATRAALCGLVLLGACLNPRPEEVPSDTQLEPSPERGGVADPTAASTPAGRDDNADSPAVQSPAVNPAPTGEPGFAPSASPDAGVSDAGDIAPSDAG